MARDRLTFRQRDVTAAIKAVKAGGLQIARVTVTKTGVTVIPGDPAPELDDARETELVEREFENAKQLFRRSRRPTRRKAQVPIPS